MAQTLIGTGHALRKTQWSTYFFMYCRFKTYFSKFIGKDKATDRRGVGIETDENAIIQLKGDFAKEKGDKVVYNMQAPLSSAGRTGDSTMEGNEEAMIFYDFDITLKQVRNAVRNTGKLDDKRPAFVLKSRAKPSLAQWMAHKLDGYTTAALSGIASSDGNVAANAPSTATRKWAGGQALGTTGIGTVYRNTSNTDANMHGTAANNYFGPLVIEHVKRKALTTEPCIAPIVIGGEERFVMFVSPYQAKALKADWQWNNEQAHANIKGETNPIFTGALGMHDGVIVHEWAKIETRLGAGGSTASELWDAADPLPSDDYGARALFCGRQATLQAFGMKPTYNTDTFDYGNQWGVAIGVQVAVSKPEFNGVDQGVIVVDTQYLAD